jgi:hypothetical protein
MNFLKLMVMKQIEETNRCAVAKIFGVIKENN